MMTTVLMAEVIWQTPLAKGKTLEEVKVDREIFAPIDTVWNIV